MQAAARSKIGNPLVNLLCCCVERIRNLQPGPD